MYCPFLCRLIPVSAAGVLVGVLCQSQSVAALATFTGLGDLPGGKFESYATDVSADGTVAIGHSKDSNTDKAFRWTLSSGIAALEGMPDTRAQGVSADGSIIVGDSYNADEFRWEAFRWTTETGAVPLLALQSSYYAYAYDVDASGKIIVGNQFHIAAFPEAALWQNGVHANIGFLGWEDDWNFSTAKAISADGAVVVGQTTIGHDDIFNGFRWTREDGLMPLGDLPGNINISSAEDVSADGKTIVGHGYSDLGQQAFRWTEAAGMIALDGSSVDALASVALGVSQNGSRIVGKYVTDQVLRAFLWTDSDGILNLREALIANDASGLNGWQLTEATAITADGRTIVGNGINPFGQNEAWIATLPVPEPSTILLVSIAIAGFWAGKSR